MVEQIDIFGRPHDAVPQHLAHQVLAEDDNLLRAVPDASDRRINYRTNTVSLESAVPAWVSGEDCASESLPQRLSEVRRDGRPRQHSARGVAGAGHEDEIGAALAVRDRLVGQNHVAELVQIVLQRDNVRGTKRPRTAIRSETLYS